MALSRTQELRHLDRGGLSKWRTAEIVARLAAALTQNLHTADASGYLPAFPTFHDWPPLIPFGGVFFVRARSHPETKVGYLVEAANGETAMATVARLLSWSIPETDADFDALKTIAMFCAACLLVSIVSATYGLDLSPAFF